MSTIVVKNLPDHLHVLLKKRAEHNHRSMTMEVVHLIEAGLESDAKSAPKAKPNPKPLPPPVQLRSGRSLTIDEIEAAIADHSAEPAAPTDGRAALRAALVKQPDGSYINVLGIDDNEFFDTLDRIRAEAQAPDVTGLFGEAT